jgi:hypothetical protein
MISPFPGTIGEREMRARFGIAPDPRLARPTGFQILRSGLKVESMRNGLHVVATSTRCHRRVRPRGVRRDLVVFGIVQIDPMDVAALIVRGGEPIGLSVRHGTQHQRQNSPKAQNTSIRGHPHDLDSLFSVAGVVWLGTASPVVLRSRVAFLSPGPMSGAKYSKTPLPVRLGGSIRNAAIEANRREVGQMTRSKPLGLENSGQARYAGRITHQILGMWRNWQTR